MKKAYLNYVLALLVFGSNGIVASHISLSSTSIVFFRTMIGSILLLGLLFASKEKRNFFPLRRQSLFLVLSGVALGASWLFLYQAYTLLGVAVASLAYYCGPIIVMALSVPLFHEKMTARKLVGFLTVLCGIVFVTGRSFQAGRPFWGFVCGAMSAVLYAAMVIFQKEAEEITGVENSAIELLSGFLTVALFMLVKGDGVGTVTRSDGFWIIMLGVINTALGCFWYFSSIGKLPVQSVAILGYLEPLSAVLFSALFLGETMDALERFGALMIIAGALFSQLPVDSRKHHLPLMGKQNPVRL